MASCINSNLVLDKERQDLAYLLGRVGLALLVIFLAVVVAAAMPPRLLAPPGSYG